MKKAKVFLMLSLTTALLLSGCGKDNSGDILRPDDIGETISAETQTVPPEETGAADESEPVDSDTPPEEGMVRSALTNEWISEETSQARPISVMFPTDRGSQPQYGIGSAGILYECMEEGEMSRQMGVIEEWQDMEQIGNIRSGRDYYVYWALEWDSFFIHWGGPFYLVDIISRSDVNNLTAATIGVPEKMAPAVGSEAFYRSDPKNPTIHNGYTNGEKLASTIDSLGYEADHRDKYYEPDHFNFATYAEPNTLEDASGSFDATSIDLSKIFTTTRSSLKYNEETGAYDKFLYGSSQIDQLTGDQLSFDNIIVQNTYWEYRPDNKYLAFKVHDTSRDGYFFTKGKGIHITWEKKDDYSPTRYFDDKGNEIILNSGKTYIAIAQDGREVIYK